MSRHDNPLGGLRSSLVDAAFAVEERVLWRGGDSMKGLLDTARWPFERVAWTLERAVVWPLEERTGNWSGAMRTLGVLAAALLATAVGVLGLLWASGGGSGTPTRAASPTAAPVTATAAPTPSAVAPVLQGTKPNFKLEGVGTGTALGATGGAAETETAPAESSASAAPTSTDAVKAGPAATRVATRFANAFVLYETGKTNTAVRSAFAETATPRVAHKLLSRPPRLPADSKVPKAEVLNVVPGPRHGDTYTLSVSLLRLGITSELRLQMQSDKGSGAWQVTEVLG